MVTSWLNSSEYPTGIRISDEQMGALIITPNESIARWNYTIWNYTISPCPN